MYDLNPIRQARSNPLHPVPRIAAYAQYPYLPEQPSQRNGGRRSRNGFVLPEKAKRTAKAAAEGAAAWLTQNRGLREALSALTNPHATAFEERAVVSSPEGAVTGVASRGADRAEYRIQVLRLARGQRNGSYELSASAPSVVGAGKHSFALTAAGRSETLAVSVAAGDSNAAMLAKLADAINGSEAAVTADVVADPEADTRRLTIAAAGTGAARAFALSDAGGFIISATGAGNVVADASDAAYRVDGGPITDAETNDLLLQDGKVSLRLHDAAQAALAAVVVDGHAVVRQLRAIIERINGLNETFENASDYLNESLKAHVDDALGSPSAKWLGIYAAPDGRWRLDEGMLAAAVAERPDHVRRLAAGPNGIADTMSETLTRFERMPADSLLSASADGFQSYMAYQASLQPYLQLQMNGAFINSIQ